MLHIGLNVIAFFIFLRYFSEKERLLCHFPIEFSHIPIESLGAQGEFAYFVSPGFVDDNFLILLLPFDRQARRQAAPVISSFIRLALLASMHVFHMPFD